MLSKMKKAVCGLFAAALMAAVSVTAFADYTYQLKGDGLCDEIKASSQEINGTEGVFETEFGDSTQEQYLSFRFKLFNEYLDLDFWQRDDVRIEVDVKLETQGADVIGCLPGFNSKWGWVNPSDYTPLKYGEWVTVSEKASHYYEEFAKSEPAYILFQVRTNWGAPSQGKVKVSVRNMRIVDGTGSGVEVEPEPTAEPEDPVVEPAATIDTEGTVQAAPSTAEQTPDTQEAAVTEPEQTTAATSAATTAQTTIRTAATAATSQSINYSELYSEPESPVMMIVIIVGIAVLVSILAVVGYLIYRKKKFY
ncbi:MAG: hypothetical protein ACI4RK_05160 [Oscillospiraceae bacterium]